MKFNFKNLLTKTGIAKLKWPIIITCLLLIIFTIPGRLQNGFTHLVNNLQFHMVKADSTIIATETDKLNKSIAKLNKNLDTYIPKKHYLIVNSTDNEFMLYKGTEMIRKGTCSTGSYMLLEKNEKERWLFKTPKGEFSIRNKTTDPVWKRPDWAFVEEGLPIPSPNHPSRFEYGVLGDYALYLGDGYMIHGTLWQRYLGLPVTHGCIRMNDEDLRVVYQNMSIGSKVFIY